MSILVLYTDGADPLVEALQATAAKLDFLHVDALLDHLSRADWPTVLELALPPALIERFKVNFIVNRCFSVAESAVGNALGSWGVPERWFHLKLQPYLELAGQRAHDVGLRGVSRSLLSLPTQWFHVREYLTDVSVPRFAYVMGQEIPDVSDFEAPMRKSIWSLFDWKQENHLPLAETRRNAFVVDKPKGVPVITYYLGEQEPLYVFPRETIELDHRRYRRLAEVSRATFRSDIGEILTYVEPSGEVTFCAFSPFMYSSSKSARFGEAMRRWVDTPA